MSMTSAVILPSIGPPPPGFRRPDVPDNLKPKLPGDAGNTASGNQLSARATGAAPAERPRAFLTGSSQSLGGAAAVSVQVSESRVNDAAPEEAPPERPGR